MTKLKILMVAAALAVTVAPAWAQVPLGYTIFNSSGQPVAVGRPRPEYRSTDIYWSDGRKGSTMTTALTAGNVLSLLREHIGCTDKVNAEIAWNPRQANPAACVLLLPNVPYELMALEGGGRGMFMVQIKQRDLDPTNALGLGPSKSPAFWVLLSTQELGT
jgi:hypothetical protein